MVLTIPMVLTYTHGIESVLMNRRRTTGPSVTRIIRKMYNPITIYNLYNPIQPTQDQ